MEIVSFSVSLVGLVRMGLKLARVFAKLMEWESSLGVSAINALIEKQLLYRAVRSTERVSIRVVSVVSVLRLKEFH